MKSVILYAHPVENDGLSIQGDMLYRGMKENGEDARPCHWRGALQLDWLYRTFQPDIAIGIGFWGYTPDLILHPKQFGVTPVPWLVADGWVANYHNVLQELPLVFVTSTWVKEVYERDGVNTKNFVVAPVAVEPEVFKPIPKSDPRVQKLRELLGVKPEEKLLLTIGGDVTSKGAQEVLRALAQANKEFKNWKYICKAWEDDGRREYSDEENALIEALKLPKERISFLSGSYSREFIPYLLNAADIYMAPSRIEGFGMIQLEAQACGIPVISINAMGPKDTVVHGETGYLAKVAHTIDLDSELVYPEMGFPEEMRIFFERPKTFAYRADIDDLASYLLELLSNDEKRKQMGEHAREHASKNFNYRDLSAKMTQIIKDRLGIH